MRKEKMNVVVKRAVILDLIQDLQRLLLPLCLRNNVRGRWQIKSAMTSFYNGRISQAGYCQVYT